MLPLLPLPQLLVLILLLPPPLLLPSQQDLPARLQSPA